MLGAGAGALACATSKTLPDYAAPKGRVVEAKDLDASDVISYRKLTQADFRGTQAPREFAPVADRVGAATCGQVRTSDDTVFLLKWRQESAVSPKQHWMEVPKLAFVALMDRRCSWWNPKTASRAPDYILEHEQIHFALYELGARKLNAAVGDIKQALTKRGASQQEVQEHAQQALNDVLAEATEQLVERNREFDQDTSLGYRPERQRVWLRRVTEELATTAAFASAPSR
jgi:hypothetical protein